MHETSKLTSMDYEVLNMNSTYFRYSLTAMLLRGDPRWNTPSGAALDLLRHLAHCGEIAEIGRFCGMYTACHPVSKSFIVGSLPSILVNHYKPLLRIGGIAALIDWQAFHPTWASVIRRFACSPRLEAVIDEMERSIRRFGNH